MKRLTRWAVLAIAGIWTGTSLRAQDLTVDTTGAGALIEQGMHHSEAMQNLEHLTDIIGPRLTGSPAARAANDWTMQRFKDYGLDAHLESWEFGGTWTRGPMWIRMTAPRKHDVIGASWAWTVGTGGKTVAGPVVLINANNEDSLDAYKSKVRGAWLMLREPARVWNNDGPAMTAADSAELRARFGQNGAPRQRPDSAARAKAAQFRVDLPYMLRNLGAKGILVDGAKEQTLLTMSGSPNGPLPLPQVAIAHEDYTLFDRLIKQGITPRIEANIQSSMSLKPVPQWNTVAEIKGSEHPGQVVIVGGHLDSWDLGTGATDNGTGSIATLEAARIIAQSGVKPKRTIRFVLFTGEEEGLLGSQAYAKAHAGEADSIQAVIVLDNGVGAVTGQALQGRTELEGLWKSILAPVASLNADSVRDANKGGTDHLSFIAYGVPGFNFDQLTRGYNHTHHSQSDTYDKAIPWDLEQASTVMAVSAVELANLSGMIPRGTKQEVQNFFGPKPSPAVVHPAPVAGKK
ncbi:MAG TPA: M20/M25/M40 family metallo-hydrolase [Gemmatimonadales bacterium]|nr:M20/M25/M40 family metallo-hydrolase [Gemmatimonadales bacterium]